MKVVYAVNCTWWDTIDKAGKNPNGLPVCPKCGSPLFEMESEELWWAGVTAHESQNNPGYAKFIEWARGKCFPRYEEAQARFKIEELQERADRLEVAEVRDEAVEMTAAIKRQLDQREESIAVDRRGWTTDEWVKDARNLMNHPDGAITSLVNGHIVALLERIDQFKTANRAQAQIIRSTDEIREQSTKIAYKAEELATKSGVDFWTAHQGILLAAGMLDVERRMREAAETERMPLEWMEAGRPMPADVRQYILDALEGES